MGWFRQLDGWVVSRKEGLVLCQQGQGLRTSHWRMRLSCVLDSVVVVVQLGCRPCAIFGRHEQTISMAKLACIGFAEQRFSTGACAIFRCRVHVLLLARRA